MSLYNLSLNNLKTVLESYSGKNFDVILEEYAQREWVRFKTFEFPYPESVERSYITELKKLKNLTFSSSDTASKFIKKQSVIVRGFHHSRYRANPNALKHKEYRSSCLAYWEAMKENYKLFKKLYLIVLKYCMCDYSVVAKGDYSSIQKGEVLDAGIYWLAIYYCKPCSILGYFKPQLAKYIINKYLNDFNIIRDPFSGYSGRMLGAWSLNKKYVGSDLNTEVVKESNKIIDFIVKPVCQKKLNLLPNLTIFQDDVLNTELSSIDECLKNKRVALLTCSPYDTREIYNNERVFLSCPEWIDKCLSKFSNYIKDYVFVCDDTVLDSKYSKYIVEDIQNLSPLAYKNRVDLNENRRREYIVKISL